MPATKNVSDDQSLTTQAVQASHSFDIQAVIVNSTAAGLVVITADSDDADRFYAPIKFANNAFAELMRATSDMLVGKNLLDCIDDNDKGIFAEAMTEAPQLQTLRYTTLDGTPLYAQVHFAPLQSPNRAEKLILCSFTDVTDLVQTNESLATAKEELEESMHRRTNDLQEFINEMQTELRQRMILEAELQRAQKRYRSLAENFPNGAVILLDRERRCLLLEGTQAEKIPIEKITDNGNAINLLGEPLVSTSEAAVTSAFEGKHHSFEVVLSGEPYLLHAVPITADRQSIDAVMLVCQNITDFKTRQQLEKEQEMTELKYRFVTIASHELRTPLAGMMLASGILRRYWDTTTDEEKWDSMQDIIQGLDRMSNLLDNILIVGKSDSGKLPFEPQHIDLVQFCRDLVREHEKSLGQTHKTLSSYNIDSLQFLGDPKLLRLIFGNLLSNAYKYSPDGTEVDFVLELSGTNVIVTVSDSGIGIPPEDIATLFDSFQRGKNVGEIQGTGLGLAIVDRSVKMHGGSISVESTLNVGTRFRVTFPLEMA